MSCVDRRYIKTKHAKENACTPRRKIDWAKKQQWIIWKWMNEWEINSMLMTETGREFGQQHCHRNLAHPSWRMRKSRNVRDLQCLAMKPETFKWITYMSGSLLSDTRLVCLYISTTYAWSMDRGCGDDSNYKHMYPLSTTAFLSVAR